MRRARFSSRMATVTMAELEKGGAKSKRSCRQSDCATAHFETLNCVCTSQVLYRAEPVSSQNPETAATRRGLVEM